MPQANFDSIAFNSTTLVADCHLTLPASRVANVLLIGVGPHARRTYLPHLMRLATELGVRLAAVAELDLRQGEETGAACERHWSPAWRCFVRPFDGELPAEVRRGLDALVVE